MDAAFNDRFIGSYLSASTLKGAVWGLTIVASARALYYNKDLPAKAGFPNGPKTRDEARKASEEVVANGAWGFGLQGEESETDVYWCYAPWTHGGRILDDQGKPAFADAAGVEALKLHNSLIDNKLTEPDPVNHSREGVQDLFKAGWVAMVVSAPFLRTQISKEAPNLKYGIAPIPVETTPPAYGVTDSVAPFKNSKVKAAAWKFLDYLFQAEPRVAFTKAEGFLPVAKPEADFVKNDPELKTFVDLPPTARFPPPVEGWRAAAESSWVHLRRTHTGKADPEKALKAAAGEVERSIR